MAEDKEAFIGIDVAKLRNAVAIADAGRDGEVRFYGEVDASPDSMRRLAAKLAGKYQRLHFCYEAGPTGYGLHRLLTGLGHSCIVVAPSLIPRKPSDRVKTNRRDALKLAKLLRAQELTEVWVPDAAHEALRDVVRARTTAVSSLMAAASTSPASCCARGSPTRASRGPRSTGSGWAGSSSSRPLIGSCWSSCWRRWTTSRPGAIG